MEKKSKAGRFFYLIPIGIMMMLPQYVNFIANGKGNAIDWLFFYLSIAGYSLFAIAAFIGYAKKK